jgi:hypothetical protein
MNIHFVMLYPQTIFKTKRAAGVFDTKKSDMKFSTLAIAACLCAGMALTACKSKSSAKGDSTKVNLDTSTQGHLSDSTMGKVPASGNDSSKNAAPGSTGPKAKVDSVVKQ